MAESALIFGGFRLDFGRRELLRDQQPVRLGSRALDILCILASAKGTLVTKDDLMARVWPGLVVEENNVQVHVSALRKVLGTDKNGESCIINVPGRGYRLIGVMDCRPPPDEPAAALALPDKPSVAVLPFVSMSNDPEQEFFADGIADDVITSLSRYPSLFVIARNSCFTYKGRAVDVTQVGRELGVRYVLEGSLRKSRNCIRVTALLVEAESGKHVWAERYERDLADIFAVQDEISDAVTIAVAPAIADAEQRRAMRKAPGSLDAWAAYQRGLWYLSRATVDDNVFAEKFFRQACDLDPAFAGGYTGVAWAQFQGAVHFQTRDLVEAQRLAETSARKAAALDAGDAEAHACLSNILRMRGDLDGALAEAQRALAISHNLACGHGELGTTLIYSGRAREGLAALQTNVRLDPRDPFLAWRLNWMAVGFYYCREYEASVEAAKRAIGAYPDLPMPYRWLAAALGQIGRTDEARAALAQAIAIKPASFEMFVLRRVPWHRPEDYAHMLEGLHKAGWEG
jgi:adenylate cyclase